MTTLPYLMLMGLVALFCTPGKATLIGENEINIFSFHTVQNFTDKYSVNIHFVLRKTNKAQERAYDYTLPAPLSSLATHTNGAVALSYEQDSLYFIGNSRRTDDLKTIKLSGKPHGMHIDGEHVYVTVQDTDDDYGTLLIYNLSSPQLLSTQTVRKNPHAIVANQTHLFIAHGTMGIHPDLTTYCDTGLSVLHKDSKTLVIFQRMTECPDAIYADDHGVYVTIRIGKGMYYAQAPDFTLKEFRMCFGPQRLLLTESTLFVLSPSSQLLSAVDRKTHQNITLAPRIWGNPLSFVDLGKEIAVLTQKPSEILFFEKETFHLLFSIKTGRNPQDLCLFERNLHILTEQGVTTIPEKVYRKNLDACYDIHAQADSFTLFDPEKSPPATEVHD